MPVDLRRDFIGAVPVTADEPTPEGRAHFVLTAGEIDGDAEAFFGRGYCHWLAGAIHSLTGWDLVTFEQRFPDGERFFAHTAVRTPQGRVLDIFGEHPSEAVADRYSRDGTVPVRAVAIRTEDIPGDVLSGIDDLRGDPLWWAKATFRGPELYGLVLHFARTLLRRHGHDPHPPQTQRPIPDQRTTTPSTATAVPTAGGLAMSSIDEIRAVLAVSNDKANATQGALAHACQEVREIQNTLQQAAEGSNQAAIQEAMGLYAQVADTTEELLGMVAAARAAVDTYTASL